jgi:hypothetical protein
MPLPAGHDRCALLYPRFDFDPLPADEMRLMLLMKDLRAFLRTP